LWYINNCTLAFALTFFSLPSLIRISYEYIRISYFIELLLFFLVFDMVHISTWCLLNSIIISLIMIPDLFCSRMLHFKMSFSIYFLSVFSPSAFIFFYYLLDYHHWSILGVIHLSLPLSLYVDFFFTLRKLLILSGNSPLFSFGLESAVMELSDIMWFRYVNPCLRNSDLSSYKLRLSNKFKNLV